MIAAPSVPEPRRSNPVPRPLVLVADDDPGVRLLLRAALRERFDVVGVADGREAVRLYGSMPGAFALVLLDLRMPGLGGPETLAALREADLGVRCCLMTGFCDPSDEEELLQRGALAVLAKPFDAPELPHVLARLLAGDGGP